MAKVIFTSKSPSDRDRLTPEPPTKQKRSSAKRGSKITLNVNVKSFGDDLSAVFEKNVAKARRENKRIVGAPDRVPAKV